jgi:hypothetical protein
MFYIMNIILFEYRMLNVEYNHIIYFTMLLINDTSYYEYIIFII